MTKYKRKKKGLTEERKKERKEGESLSGDINVYNTRSYKEISKWK